MTDGDQRVPETYVLITAAHNEGARIRETIESVLAQSMRPTQWSIVSDNSEDNTDEIIQEYSEVYRFITFGRISRKDGRSFGAKVRALQLAHSLLEGTSFRFIGNLDADITLPSDYYEVLLARMRGDKCLGIVSGAINEMSKGKFAPRTLNSESSVAHAAQIVRLECYEAIGGYAILEYGGEDWHAQISACMKGWKVHTYADLPVLHHRATGRESGALFKRFFRQGQMDYSMGSYPPFEFLKCLRRIAAPPLLIGSVLRLCGFAWPYLKGEQTPVAPDFVKLLRAEQRKRLLDALLRGM